MYTEEVRRLESEINRAKKEYEILLEENCQALEELQQLRRLNSEQQAQSLDQSQKIKELHRHLEAKEELVFKTDEVLIYIIVEGFSFNARIIDLILVIFFVSWQVRQQNFPKLVKSSSSWSRNLHFTSWMPSLNTLECCRYLMEWRYIL